jgi:hypothetical protein
MAKALEERNVANKAKQDAANHFQAMSTASAGAKNELDAAQKKMTETADKQKELVQAAQAEESKLNAIEKAAFDAATTKANNAKAAKDTAKTAKDNTFATLEEKRQIWKTAEGEFNNAKALSDAAATKAGNEKAAAVAAHKKLIDLIKSQAAEIGAH